MEILATGISASELGRFSATLSSLESATATPNGVHLVLGDPGAVDEALALIRECGGKLVSINPRRASLEDLFAETEPSQ